MVNHPCPNCGEVFHKKSTYINHLNRKKPCKKPEEKSIILQKNPKNPKNPKNSENILKNEEKNEENDKNINKKNIIDKKIDKNEKSSENNEKKSDIDLNDENKCDNFECLNCFKTFTTKSNLSKHIKNNCKIIKEKNKILNNEEKSKDNLIINDKILKILEINQILIEKLENQEKMNEELKKQLIFKKNEEKQPININFNQIINIYKHGEENLDKIEDKDLIHAMIKNGSFGIGLITNVIETIYVNPKYPEFQNIYITDVNRQKCKIFDGKKWIYTNFDVIFQIISKVIEHSKEKLNIFQNLYRNNKNVYDKLKIFKKYLNLCDPEYLQDLIDEMENDYIDNKDKIKDCKEKTLLLENKVINLFYNNKDTICKKNDKIIELN